MNTRKLLGVVFCAAMATLAGCSGSDDGYKGITSPVEIIPEEEDIFTQENIRSYMADPNATAETVALFYNLKKLQKTKYLIGQQDAFNSFYNNQGGSSDIKKATGSDPALLGSDFMFITDNQNNGDPSNWFYQQELKITADVKEAYSKGMVNIFCWHLREPYHGETFYADDMTAEEKATAFASILPNGANHAYFVSKLDKVADVLNNLKAPDGKLIPVIFRPFHEFDGSWFWWGANYATPEQYKQAWQFLVAYLRDTKGVHNVIYAFSPDNTYTTESQYLSRYPGDAFVDVLGMDNYGDFSNGSIAGVTTANNKLKMVSDIAKAKVKVAAMTETGWQVTTSTPVIPAFFNTNIYTAMTANDVQLAFLMFWNNTQTGYYVPPSGVSNTQDFIDLTKKEESVLQNNIPSMYAMPVE
ncbi:glycoside hydrolase family 26 protein [Flavobacterium subsaxonicum]|uniref:glycoside hydrolase family 26 protein n=1 Tax=Flavobacterium subsaxonicum TaxID=426226 RepID=UPI0004024BA1|nr:glycosyl hydrolase [Flavobacterium subsaxonicum]